jgi:hypothetical protein
MGVCRERRELDFVIALYHLKSFSIFIPTMIGSVRSPYFLSLLLLVGIFPSAIAQRSATDSLQRLVDRQPDSTRHGFFHATKFNSTFHLQVEGDVSNSFSSLSGLFGVGGTWVVNHKIAIGGRFDILTAAPVQSGVYINKYIHSYDSVGGTSNTITPSHMSAMVTVGYIFLSHKKISIEPVLGLGWANANFSDPKAGWIDKNESKSEWVNINYAIINPALNIIWNASKYYRLGFTVGARGIIGSEYLRLKSYRVGGAYVGVVMRFGTF